jgi:predicted TIM-barrel fold metal-dependent hydrolase
MVVEWNAHMFTRRTDLYPFHPHAAYTPSPESLPDDPLVDYVLRMDREGIDRAILVHPEPYGDDHTLVLDCLRREPDRLRATSLFYPMDPDAPGKLRDLVSRQPGIVAFRFHAHRGKEMYLDSFQDSSVTALWEMAGDLGLVVELHIGPNYADDAGKVIADHPGIPVLIDHLAEPGMGSSDEYKDVLSLARYENVTMKLSGLGHISQDAPLYEDVKPLTRRVAEAFGPDRLVWGGGMPAIVDAHLDFWTVEERARVKGETIRKLIRWD